MNKTFILNFFAHFKISTKLWLGLGTMALLLAVVSITALRSLGSAGDKITSVVDVSQPTVVKSMQLAGALDHANAGLGFYLLSKTDNDKSDYENALLKLDQILNELKALPGIKSDSKATARVQQIETSVAKYENYRDQMVKLAVDENLNQPGMGYSSGTMGPIAIEIQQNLSQMLTAEDDEAATPARKKLFSQMANLRQIWMNIVNNVRAYLAFRGKDNIDNIKLFRDGFTAGVEKLASSEALNFTQEDAIGTIQASEKKYFTALDKLIQIHSSDRWRTDSYLIRSEIGPLVQNIQSDVDWLVKHQGKLANSSAQELMHDISATRQVVWWVVVLGILVSVGGGWFLVYLIVGPLKATVDEIGRAHV